MIVIKKKTIQKTFIVLEQSFIEDTGNWTILAAVKFHFRKREDTNED